MKKSTNSQKVPRSIRYLTFGPYELPRKAGVVDRAGLKALWKQAKDDHDRLPSAIGVYIVSVRDHDGNLIPWYVGKTDKGFKQRFGQHVSAGKSFVGLRKIPGKGSLHVFLVARGTDKGDRFRKKTAAGDRVKSIGVLEFNLIADCLKRNSKLLNLSNAAFHKNFHVPGYVNDESVPRNEAASELAAMLKKS